MQNELNELNRKYQNVEELCQANTHRYENELSALKSEIEQLEEEVSIAHLEKVEIEDQLKEANEGFGKY